MRVNNDEYFDSLDKKKLEQKLEPTSSKMKSL